MVSASNAGISPLDPHTWSVPNGSFGGSTNRSPAASSCTPVNASTRFTPHEEEILDEVGTATWSIFSPNVVPLARRYDPANVTPQAPGSFSSQAARPASIVNPAANYHPVFDEVDAKARLFLLLKYISPLRYWFLEWLGYSCLRRLRRHASSPAAGTSASIASSSCGGSPPLARLGSKSTPDDVPIAEEIMGTVRLSHTGSGFLGTIREATWLLDRGVGSARGRRSPGSSSTPHRSQSVTYDEAVMGIVEEELEAVGRGRQSGRTSGLTSHYSVASASTSSTSPSNVMTPMSTITDEVDDEAEPARAAGQPSPSMPLVPEMVNSSEKDASSVAAGAHKQKPNGRTTSKAPPAVLPTHTSPVGAPRPARSSSVGSNGCQGRRGANSTRKPAPKQTVGYRVLSYHSTEVQKSVNYRREQKDTPGHRRLSSITQYSNGGRRRSDESAEDNRDGRRGSSPTISKPTAVHHRSLSVE